MNEAARARTLHAQGQLDIAEPLYRVAVRASPYDLTLRRDFAVLLMQSRREHHAIALFNDQELEASTNSDLLSVIALCLRATAQFDRGLVLANRIVTLDPNNALGWLLKGSLHVLLGGHTAAETALLTCLDIERELPEAWHYLGESLQAQQRWNEAISAYQESQRRQPLEVLNIAICHERAGRLNEAAAGYHSAHQLMPGRADVLARLAYAQASLCRFEETSTTSDALTSRLQTPLAQGDYPEPFLLTALGLAESAKIAALERYVARIGAVEPFSAVKPERKREERIRIGYVSPDFGAHAVGDLIRSHFSAHDRDRFHVTAYSLRDHGDLVNDEIREGVDVYLRCHDLDDAALAERVRLDRIDVLIDLAGYTSGARPAMFAKRPAPLQIGWLGFLDGQQAPWLDAIVMDDRLLPEKASWPYSDTIVRMATTVFPGSRPVVGTPDRSRVGLPSNVVLFCSFNNAYKIDELVVDAWIRILQLASEAHFVLFLPDSARRHFLEHWVRKGGDPARLHMVAESPMAEHADRMASCDIVLDAFRYQGGATSMLAIANGLPVLSVSGSTPPERLGASINGFLGLDDLVCDDIEAYVQTAVRLAQSPDDLAEMRRRLGERAFELGLFDPRRSAEEIESLIVSLMESQPHTPPPPSKYWKTDG